MAIIKNMSPRFVAIPDETVRDERLMGEHLGLLTFLANLPPEWEVSIDWIVRQKRFGASAKVCHSLKHLRECGYVRLTKKVDGSTVWDVSSMKDTFPAPSTLKSKSSSGGTSDQPSGSNPPSDPKPNFDFQNVAYDPDFQKPNFDFRNFGFQNVYTYTPDTNTLNTFASSLIANCASEPTSEKSPPKTETQISYEPPCQQTAEEASKTTAKPLRREKPAPITGETWKAYSAGYKLKYGIEPKRDQVINGQLANFVKRVGADLAPILATEYLEANDRWYVQDRHSVRVMVSSAETLRNAYQLKLSGKAPLIQSTGVTHGQSSAQQRRNAYYDFIEQGLFGSEAGINAVDKDGGDIFAQVDIIQGEFSRDDGSSY